MLVALRTLYHSMARYGVRVRADFIRSEDNTAADAASRGDWARFHAHVRDVLGVEVTTRVKPALDVGALLLKMKVACKGEVCRRARSAHSGGAAGRYGERTAPQLHETDGIGAGRGWNLG